MEIITTSKRPTTTAPDLSLRINLKLKYQKLQESYSLALQTRKDLKIELIEKESKLTKLQDEIELIIDQIQDNEKLPLNLDYFNDDPIISTVKLESTSLPSTATPSASTATPITTTVEGYSNGNRNGHFEEPIMKVEEVVEVRAQGNGSIDQMMSTTTSNHLPIDFTVENGNNTNGTSRIRERSESIEDGEGNKRARID